MDLTILNNSNLSLTASSQWDMWQWECVHNCSLGEVGRLATYDEYCNGLEGDEDLIPYGGVRKGPNGNGRYVAIAARQCPPYSHVPPSLPRW